MNRLYPKKVFGKVMLGLGLCFAGDDSFSQQIIYQHDFGATTISTHPYTVQPGNLHPSITNSIWSNSTDNWTSFAGSSGQAIGLRNNAVITLSFQLSSGYKLALSQFSFWCQSSSTGAQNWSMTINEIPVGSGAVPQTGKSTGNVNVMNPVNQLSGLITIEITLTGATSGSGTFRLDDFTLIGSVIASETYFQSRQDGDWSLVSTWQSSPDNISWYQATKTPTKDAENILIKPGHTVKVTSPVSFDQTTIAGILELQNGGILNINDGVGDDLSILSNGSLKILTTDNYATSVNQIANTNINIAKGGKIMIGNGISSMGKGYEVFATSLVNKWNDGAVFEFNDVNVFPIAGLIYFPNTSEDEVPIFRVSKVNGTIAAGAGNDFLLNGLLELNTDITFTGGGHKTFRDGIRGSVTLTQLNAGKIKLTGSNAILTGAPLKMVLGAVIDFSQQMTNIPAGATVIVGGKNIANPGNLVINGTLDVTTISISNPGSIFINGVYRTANPGGFSGISSSITPTAANITLNFGSTIELYANGTQSLTSRPDFKNITFSGSGLKIAKAAFNANGTITIKDDAIFDCNGNNVGDDNTNLTMTDNSRLIVYTVNTNPQMNGIYNLTGGVIEFKGSGGTAQTIRNQTYQHIEVTGTKVNNSDGNIILRNGGTFTVKSGGVFTINDNTITGPVGVQTVIVESGGTFKSGNTKGFHGFAFTTAPKFNSSINADIENIILQPNSTVEYSRASPPLSSGDQPITNANNLIYQNLVLSGTGNKIAPSDNLVIQGNFSKTGSAIFVHNSGSVIFNGSIEQIYKSTSPQMVFNVLKNENTKGLNVNDSLSVYKELFFGDNSKINLNADITLLSNKYQTASVSRLSINVNIHYGVGRFIVERFINTNTNGGHGKSWQLISTPAFGETIFDTWQEKGSKNIVGYGTWITDISGADKGFDAVSFTPSMKYFDAASYQWIGIPTTNSNLENEKGYMIFVRGDRKSNTLNSPATPTILRTRGKIYTNQFLPPQSIVPAQKFQCVGNPYASAIDFSKIIRSPEIENSFRVWDPEFYGIYGLGGYQTIPAATGYKAVPGGTSIYNTTSDYRNIQSGQAFFVYNFAATEGSVSFSEECKMEDAHHLVNRVSSPEISERPILFAKLISESNVVDGNAVVYDKIFSNKIDRDDALKISNSNENFGIKRNGKILIVEAREEIKTADTIFYNLENLSKKGYKLFFLPEKFQQPLQAILVDEYLKTESSINLKDTSSIDFSITSDVSSAMANRFLLIIKPVPLPIEISLNASEKNANVFLEWNIKNEKEIKEYQIEYSTDGINFSLLEIISASNNYTGNYNQVHRQPVTGANYYRIRIEKIAGKIEYSGTVKVLIPEICSGINIYPNPIHGENINLLFLKQTGGNYQLRLLNSSGQVIVSKEIKFSGGNDLQTLPLKKNMTHGIYYVEIKKPNGEKQRQKVIY
ncbi:MAG: T9SS type A sorting domain-containing protein [Ginsengibacter sp.]